MAQIVRAHGEIKAASGVSYVMDDEIIKHNGEKLKNIIDNTQTSVSAKADKEYVDTELAKKVDETTISILLNYVTPEIYGAKGDGVTDDTEAIQQCINNNSNVRFLNKTYLITAPIIINRSGMKITGDKNTCIKKITDTTTGEYSFRVNNVSYSFNVNAFFVIAPPKGSNDNSVGDIEIDNFYFKTRNNIQIYLTYVSNAFVTKISNYETWTSDYGVYIEYSWGMEIDRCKFFGLEKKSVSLYHVVSTYVNNCYSSTNAYRNYEIISSNCIVSSCSIDVGSIFLENSRCEFNSIRTESATHTIYSVNSYFTASNCDFERHQDSASTKESAVFALIGNSIGIIDASTLRFQNYTSEATYETLSLYYVETNSRLVIELTQIDVPTNSNQKSGIVKELNTSKMVDDYEDSYTEFLTDKNTGYIRIDRFMQVCVCRVAVTANSDINNNEVIGTVPFKPKNNMSFILERDGVAKKCLVLQDKTIIADDTIEAGTWFGQLIYVTD